MTTRGTMAQESEGESKLFSLIWQVGQELKRLHAYQDELTGWYTGPNELLEDEELIGSLEGLLASMRKWVEPVERRERIAHLHTLLQNSVDKPIFQDEYVDGAIRLLEERLQDDKIFDPLMETRDEPTDR